MPHARARLTRRLTAAAAFALALLCATRAAAKPRVRLGSNLDDVPDSEEDDAWREWGKRSEPKKIEGACACHGVCARAALLTRCACRAYAGGDEAGVLAGACFACVTAAHADADADADALRWLVQLQLSIVSVDAAMVRSRHGATKARTRVLRALAARACVADALPRALPGDAAALVRHAAAGWTAGEARHVRACRGIAGAQRGPWAGFAHDRSSSTHSAARAH